MSGKKPGTGGRYGGDYGLADPSTETGEPSFQFESFARSEADAAAEQEAVARRVSAEPTIEARQILRRSYLPPGDVVIDTRPVGNMTVVTLRGRINEAFRGGELGRSLSGVVVFDLAEVDRVSSFGVKGWLQMLDTSRMVACYFYRCSEAVINQITMMRNFCGPGRIHSLMVPYACSHCGEEFGSLYEAVSDREYLLGRSPARVSCPNCSNPADMDDDPWSYFALDEHLLTVVPPDLQQVIDHLNSTNRTDPIEKFISEQETRIRFNAPLDGRLRFRRAFSGLEGRVTLDLSVSPSADGAGVQRLLGALRDLDAEVTEAWLDGAPSVLIRALLDDPIPRVYVSSVFVEARCLANGIRRNVLVDIERQRAVLRNRGLPPIEANWAVGPVDVADTDVLFRAADLFGPPTAPAPPVGFRTSENLVPQQEAGNPGFGPRQWQMIAVGTATASLLAVFVMIAAVALLFVFRGDLFGFGSQSSAQETAADGWDGGNPLPPAWVEQPFVVGDALVKVVGRATGTDAQMELIAERSRVDATYELILNLRARIAGTDAGRGLSDLPADIEPQQVVDRFAREMADLGSLSRSSVSIRRESDQVTLVTQHVLQRDTWENMAKFYGETRSFRGLQVARRFPTEVGEAPHQSTPLVITDVPSWFSNSASRGDGLLSVNGRSVKELRSFSRLARNAFEATDEGKSMTMEVFHGRRLAEVEFEKPVTSKPALPLFDFEEGN